MKDSALLPRRKLLQIGLASAGLLIAAPSLAAASVSGHSAANARGMKELAFYNLHTDEKLRTTFWKNGSFDQSAIAKINRLMRDFRTGEVYPISLNLIEMLHNLQDRLRTDAVIELISGYRSPKTNARLAGQSDGVAKRSFHTEGLAVDIRMRGISLRKIQSEALFLKRGGVGYYPKSNFVHVDVGPVRRWG